MIITEDCNGSNFNDDKRLNDKAVICNVLKDNPNIEDTTNATKFFASNSSSPLVNCLNIHDQALLNKGSENLSNLMCMADKLSFEDNCKQYKCRICLEEEKVEVLPKINSRSIHNNNLMLLNPCKCKGSSACIHQDCIKQWILSKYEPEMFFKATCELCLSKYKMNTFNVNLSGPQRIKVIKLGLLMIFAMVTINIALYYILIQSKINLILFNHYGSYLILALDIFYVFFLLWACNRYRLKIKNSNPKDFVVVNRGFEFNN